MAPRRAARSPLLVLRAAMSFLDELADVCEASWCPRCKDDPEAVALRARLSAEARERMIRPLRLALVEMQPPRAQGQPE